MNRFKLKHRDRKCTVIGFEYDDLKKSQKTKSKISRYR